MTQKKKGKKPEEIIYTIRRLFYSIRIWQYYEK